MALVCIQRQSPWCIQLMSMLPLFHFLLPLLFSLVCSTNTSSAAPKLQTTSQRNFWILKYQLFLFQPALLAFTTSDHPNSVSNHNPSFGIYHLNRQLKSNHKTFLFPLSSTQRHAPFPLQLISFFHHNW